MKTSTHQILSVSFLGIALCFLTWRVMYSLESYQQMFQPCLNFEKYLENGERYKLYDAVNNKTISQKTKLAGLYSFSNDIYCIWNGSQYKQNYSEMHEYCHYLIDEEECFNSDVDISCKEHFCE